PHSRLPALASVGLCASAIPSACTRLCWPVRLRHPVCLHSPLLAFMRLATASVCASSRSSIDLHASRYGNGLQSPPSASTGLAAASPHPPLG
ncbi:MAG: hypothetical protein K8963_05690, partial [Proteobacteria bacterium]|nr:hypothetical protein [Pseudomonadota bacterium]